MIDYGVLQTLLAKARADGDAEQEELYLQLVGTTAEVADKRIERSKDTIKRKRKRAANEKLAASMGEHLADMVLVGKDTKSARDWAIIAHDRIQKAKGLRAEAKPIQLALEAFREGKLKELVAKGEAEIGTAFAFKVVQDKEGNRIVSWTPKGTRGMGGGIPNGTLVGALDGQVMSWTAMYTKVMGKEYGGRDSHSKQICSHAPKGFDFTRITYNPDAGAPSAIADLVEAGAIAVGGLGNE